MDMGGGKMKMGFEPWAMMRPNHPYGRAHAQTVEIGGRTIRFKSQTEVNFAMVLERLREAGAIVSWDYEPKEFWFEGIKRGRVSYKPDFLAVWADHIHNDETPGEVYYETKCSGGLKQVDVTKYHRMAIYHPDVKLVLVLPRSPSQGNSKSAIRQRILLENAEKYIDHVTYLTDWRV